MDQFADSDKIGQQVISADGYDEVIAILENYSNMSFPCVIFEDPSLGVISINDGPLETSTCTIWVMTVRDREDNNAIYFTEIKALAMEILKLLVKGYNAGDSEMKDWDAGRVGWAKRLGGPNCLGYEFTLTFNEDINLYEE
ncbi:MAG: hypothetical protein EOM45_14300 [Clostridia bacterium]|nr:hypothetical protein [Clostridia bacterium]